MRSHVRSQSHRKRAIVRETEAGIPYVIFNGSDTYIDGRSEAGIDNLIAADFTVEGWWRFDSYGESDTGRLFYKAGGLTGWEIFMYNPANLRGPFARTYMDTVNAETYGAPNTDPNDGAFHHWRFVWDFSAKKWGIARDGTKITYGKFGGGLTNVTDDSVRSLYLGGNGPTLGMSFHGAMGWQRICNTALAITGFTPDAMDSPPEVDANTLLLWKVDEGEGDTLDNAEGTALRDGTIKNGSWGTL